ncbi:XRE family transcriptional regulator [Burkholderia gladioli]|uniref:XRE family transcriptional regulator n=1 Tax=Burkholderia gladioli TaxID=28095 RepID=UPI0016403B2F|nr:helix-turn-helix domain-containing protein [Burkholderia gladioli]
MSEQTVGDRVRAVRNERGMSQKELGRLAGVTQPTISSLEAGKSHSSGAIASIATALNVDALWLETGVGTQALGTKRFRRVLPEGNDTEELEYDIPVLQSEGSCGAGMDADAILDMLTQVSPLRKDQRFFTRTGADPIETFALIADGPSMSPFIEHADIVLFCRKVDRYISGKIYAFETPEGPRIKRVRRRTDGSIVLACDSPDKNRFPDEIYSDTDIAALRCLGRQIYREG